MRQGSDETGRSELRLTRCGTAGNLQRATILPGNYNHMEVWVNSLSYEGYEPTYTTSWAALRPLNLDIASGSGSDQPGHLGTRRVAATSVSKRITMEDDEVVENQKLQHPQGELTNVRGPEAQQHLVDMKARAAAAVGVTRSKLSNVRTCLNWT